MYTDSVGHVARWKSMVPSHDAELRATAYHEAGHAVAAFVLRRPIRTASIEPAEGSLGRVEHHPPGKWFQPDAGVDTRTRNLVKRHIVGHLAGPLAEERFTGSHNETGATSDHHHAVDLASYLVDDDERLQILVDDLSSRAAELLARTDVWRAVEAVAEELVRDRLLAGREVRAVIRRTGLRPGGRVFAR